MHMVLADREIAALQKNSPPLIENEIHWDTQLQPNGFDLTAGDVYSFKSHGSLDFSNKERELPDAEPVKFDGMWAHLEPGVYKIKTNEIISLPKDIIAFCQTRSSLLRMGVIAGTAFWDAGFSGKGEFVIQVVNPHGMRLKKNARVVQIAFIRLPEPVENEYSGQYKHLR